MGVGELQFVGGAQAGGEEGFAALARIGEAVQELQFGDG